MEQKLNAITLFSVDVGEFDKMITFFTLERGIIGVGAKGVKKDKARLKFTAEPFCFSEIVVAEKSGRITLVNADCRKSYYKISADITKYFSSCAIAEILRICCKDEPEEELFTRLVFALEKIAGGVNKPVVIKFILDVISASGYAPDFSCCSVCGGEIVDRVYLAEDYSFNCHSCGNGVAREFSYLTFSKLKQINRTDYADLAEENGEVITNCLKFLSFVTEGFFGIKNKSLGILIDS